MAGWEPQSPQSVLTWGTTYSVCSVWKHNRIPIIPMTQGNPNNPSCVAFNDKGNVLIGEGANNQIARTLLILSNAKRLNRKEIQRCRSPLTSMIFASSNKGCTTIAGLQVIRMFNEPTALQLLMDFLIRGTVVGQVYELRTLRRNGTRNVKGTKERWKVESLQWRETKRSLSYATQSSIELEVIYTWELIFYESYSCQVLRKLNMNFFTECINKCATGLAELSKIFLIGKNYARAIFSTKSLHRSSSYGCIGIVVREQNAKSERTRSKDNYLLGQFEISGIPPAPKGVSKVEDTFKIDANGILTVTSKVVSTGKTETLTVTNHSGRFSDQEIEKMVKDAEKYKLEDQEYKRKVDAFNDLEDFLYVVKRKSMMNSNEISAEVLRNIEYAVNDATVWLSNNKDATIDEIEAKKFHLEFISKVAISF
ncbi:putative heat shock protein 70 family protein [Tanacetum coccineum]